MNDIQLMLKNCAWNYMKHPWPQLQYLNAGLLIVFKSVLEREQNLLIFFYKNIYFDAKNIKYDNISFILYYCNRDVLDQLCWSNKPKVNVK